jgi:solute carrier family 35 protein E3
MYVCVCFCLCCAALCFTRRRFGEKTSRAVQASLVVILLGVGIATISDVDINMTGSVFAACAVVCTSLGQIFTNSKPKELGLDSMQLLYHVSPIITLFMLILIPVGSVLPGFDQVVGERSLSRFQWTTPVVCWIFLTCILAFGVNVTNYLVIARTSPVTYQVVGHLKTCLILILGFVVFHYAVVVRNLFGISLAVVGMVWYTEQKRRESSQQPTTTAYMRVPTAPVDVPPTKDGAEDLELSAATTAVARPVDDR